MQEKDAKDVEIPNIRWDVFELMMRCGIIYPFCLWRERERENLATGLMLYIACACRYIYTGSVDANLDVAQELLRAADQYLLEGLKRLCECAIAQVSHEISCRLIVYSRESHFELIVSNYRSPGHLGGKCFSHVRIIRGI